MARTCRVSLALVGMGFLAAACGLVVPARAAQESWDSVYIANSKVGYIHLRLEPLEFKGEKLIRVRYDMVFRVKRDKDEVTIEQSYGTIETPEGEVRALETRTLTGGTEMRTKGRVDNGQMRLVLSGGGQNQEMTIPWGADVRGPYAAELSLSRQPIKPGETREVKTFIPELNKVCNTKLVARDFEDVELGGGAKRSLLRVDAKVTNSEGKPVPGLDPTFWIDDGGQILKSFTDALGGMLTYRTTREAAQALAHEKLDLLATSIAKVKQKIRRPDATRGVVYRVRMKDDDPSKIFPTDRRQKIKQGSNPQSATIEVRTAGPNVGEPGPDQVDEEFLLPNALINSKDSKVVELTQKAVGNRQDPWEKAVAIEQWVFKHMERKNFAVAFADAAQVARNLEGDCSEHSVLTAAMCRAAGIPARAAIGMVYAEPLGGFGFHMWNEVYVNRRWVAIDSAFDQSDVDAVHIKLADTSMAGVSPYETFLSVVRVFKKMTIEPMEVR